MDIVIVGAGTIGLSVASLLSKKEQDIILVDIDAQKLELASRTLDIATRHCSGTDWHFLEELADASPAMLLAVTDRDETNLVMCAMAKSLGYGKTLARIRDANYFNRSRLDFGRLFNVDHFLGPELLAAHDLLNRILLGGARAAQSFAHGAITMRTLEVPSRWRKRDLMLKDLNLPDGMVVSLLRRSPVGARPSVIFPHGGDCILPGDEVTLIGENQVIQEIEGFFACTRAPIQSVVIAGGSLIGVQLARSLLQRKIKVRLIEEDFQRCCWLAEHMHGCTVLHHDPTDRGFLEEEKVEKADVFVAVTPRDETNLLLGALTQSFEGPRVFISVGDAQHLPFAQQMKGVSFVSPQACAANRVLSILESEKISSVVSLYEGEAEIIEVRVSLDSKIAGIPLARLGPLFPKDFLIAVIQNRGRIMVANGHRILSPGDTVIAISHPRHVKELQTLF